ncbi:MAG TPA: nucleoside triphosphate pyrophosphatase [Wenzhouxiangella sp.]|nr:nucleoside triphosphate pyrophosphatase [Wenzhouxiangella sp.]
MQKQHPPRHLVLASGSAYRAALLRRLNLEFEIITADIDERPGRGETGRALAQRLAAAKALAVSDGRPDALVIGSDQVAECEGRLLGKPGCREKAVDQLMFTSGKKVVFHTAMALCHGDNLRQALVPTTVSMRSLDKAQIERYVDADHPLDCAGAFKSEALGISLTEGISSDDPTALIGLPLIQLVALLNEFGWPLP